MLEVNPDGGDRAELEQAATAMIAVLHDRYIVTNDRPIKRFCVTACGAGKYA